MPLHKYYYIISPLYAKLELQQNRPHYLNIASINPTHPLRNSGLEMHQLTTALTPHVSLYLGADNWGKKWKMPVLPCERMTEICYCWGVLLHVFLSRFTFGVYEGWLFQHVHKTWRNTLIPKVSITQRKHKGKASGDPSTPRRGGCLCKNHTETAKRGGVKPKHHPPPKPWTRGGSPWGQHVAVPACTAAPAAPGGGG